PLVGRTRELELLGERWARARGGAGHAVLLTGEAGIGKSRLLHAFEEQIRGQTRTSLECRCTPDSANHAFYPLIDLLQRLLDLGGDTAAGGPTARLEVLLARYGFNLAEA